MGKKITISLTEESEAYFNDIIKSIDIKNPSASDAVNYALKTLQVIEAVIGDPLTFVQDLSDGKKVIAEIPQRTWTKEKCSECGRYEGHSRTCSRYYPG